MSGDSILGWLLIAGVGWVIISWVRGGMGIQRPEVEEIVEAFRNLETPSSAEELRLFSISESWPGC